MWPGLAGLLEGVEQPPLVSSQVDDDERGTATAQGELTADGDVAAVDHGDATSERAEICRELLGDATLGIARQHEHVVLQVGEQRHDGLERGRVDGVERGLDVGQLGRPMPDDRLIALQLTDPLGGRSELTRQITLDGGLQRS